MPLSEYISSLGDNPYFGAGAGLFAISVLSKAGLKGLQAATMAARRRFVLTMEVTSQDKSYQWLLNWIEKYGHKSQHLSVVTDFEQSQAGQIQTKFNFIPSMGNHYFWYNRNLILVERSRDNKMVEVFETVTLTALGNDRTLFTNILEESRDLALTSTVGKTVMYTAFGAEWRTMGYPRRKRPLNSVVLDHGVSEKIHDDIQEFTTNAKWYMDRGIPYRRGYLLYGPPGCGKSSYIFALAGLLLIFIAYVLCLNSHVELLHIYINYKLINGQV